MKALVKTAAKKGFELKEVPAPKIGPDEVLIKVSVASICGSDLHLYNWDCWAQKHIKNFPLTVGHEFAGIVEKTGKEVISFKPGDYVSAESHLFCSRCPECLERKFHLCRNTRTIGFDKDGCFADYIALPEKVVWKNEPGLPKELASIQEPFGNSVYCVLIEDVSAKTVAVFGDGPTGLFACEVSRVSGAKKVIMAGVEPYRLNIAKKLGVITVNAEDCDPVDYILEKTGGGADVVLEMSGAPSAISRASRAVRPGGRICAFGLSAADLIGVDWNEIVFKGVTIYGIHGRLIFDTWVRVKNMMMSGELNLGPVITHRFPLEKFKEAFRLAASRRCGKIILVP